MGIPKFFRWISERYPLTSQLITPNNIPTFDNLYLDMNGIIHNCSHPASSENDPHFRITEEQMILAIFAYIDHLFTKIKPQKVFFMAIDGVAPRAKMNQQRSRRFRTARDAVEQRKEAARKGETLPEEKAFDSNCITPGTPFMARLSAHLKYYVTKRITEDAEWRNVKVILSGHDVPGEGEHKIQEFIRLTKAQPDYNPNTRHCLYGLDADLIMLGLLSHDPHFCLLREEVTFGRKQKKNTGLSGTNFFLLHLSLLREYLDLEFSSLATQIEFEYDFERIIDDFILMGIFVGNDFLPHLPDLHINEGALERIWAIYKEILPQAGGYLNEHGTISLPRLQLMLDKLAKFEVENFEEEFAEENWYKGKQQKNIEAMEKARKKGAFIITKDQKKIYNSLKTFVTKHKSKPSASDRWTWPNDLVVRDRRFLQELSDDLHLHLTWDETDDYGQNLIVATFNMEGVSEDEDEGEDADAEEDGEGEWSDEQEEEKGETESALAIVRVLTKYDKAKVVDNVDENWEESYEEKLKSKLEEWKKGYYKGKLECDTKEEARQVSFKYIEGLQWILNYYYKGVSSWSWFYPYHYAPRITDLVKIDEFEFNFQYGKPFTPYQQLMGVLPAESQEHVPAIYRDLMTEETSPIIDFYPVDFELDMNGKKQDWEAVVKIPFIDQERLLKAMAPRDARLSGEEKARNNGNVLSTQFNYDDSVLANYPSSHPGFFPDIVGSRCRSEPFDLPMLGNGIDLIHGLLEGVHLGSGALAGFPSLHTIPHQGALGYHGVSVFQSDSRNQSMIITLTTPTDRPKTAEIAKKMIGQKTYHAWPYLHEGMVVAVSDDMFKYELQQMGKSAKVIANPHNPFQAVSWRKQADHAEHHQSKRFGVITGHVEVVLHVRPLKGLKRLDTGALVKDYETAERELVQPYQLAVTEVTFEDERFLERPAPPLNEEFPNGERVIFLGNMAYGVAAQVTSTGEKTMDINLAYFPNEAKENTEFTRIVSQRPSGRYYPSPVLCRRIGISALALSRITSTLLVQLKDGLKINVGLALKFESKGLKVLGYSRRNDRGWEFSEVTAQTLERYKAAFPEPFHYFDSRGGDIVTSSELCPTAENPDAIIKEMKKWLKAEGLSDLEPVSLFAEQLEKETVKQIEQLADLFLVSKTPEVIKRAVVRGIPRQAVLKPAHSVYRLQGQSFVIGDRVIMVQDSAVGGVPLAMKGVVVGLGSKDIDVVWDVPFMGGETLQGRCSDYRGSSINFDACLNLTRPQFTVGAQTPPAPMGARAPFKPQLGPQPAVQMNNYRPANPSHRPVQVLVNPARHTPQAPHTNGVGYGNAAKGIRPPPTAPTAPAGRHQDHLASVLTGQQRIVSAQQAAAGTPGRMAYVMPPRGSHLPPRPMNGAAAAKPVVAKPPPSAPAAMIVVAPSNGEADATPQVTEQATRGKRGGRGGRGGSGRGRGGRGRGGAAAAAA